MCQRGQERDRGRERDRERERERERERKHRERERGELSASPPKGFKVNCPEREFFIDNLLVRIH